MRKTWRQVRLIGLMVGVLGSAFVTSPADAEEGASSFEQSILPLLERRCQECHNVKKRSGKLNLANATGIARGGESGLVVVAGQPDQSPLWQKVADEEMPPDQPLGDSERKLIREWIESGAHGLPAGASVGRAGDGADHWAFQPIRHPQPAMVRDASRVRNEIDHFIQAELETHGLTLGPEADRAVLLRRLSFDLTGLPPTPAEIAAFLSDTSTDAYERVVEHYLASPHYGERWGRHWLDAAGYADSNGYFNADTDRPLAYRYRDYVIRAMNADMPFDRFLTEQLAGDELAGYRPDCDVTGEHLDLYTATHLLRNAQDGTDSSDGNDDELLLDRFTVLEGTVQILGSSLLGLTLQCARCHDHKFEPVSQAEYYQLQAIFFPAYRPDHWVKAAERVVTVGTRAEREAHAQQNHAIDAEVESLEKSIAAASEPLRAQLRSEGLAKLEAPDRMAVQAALDKPENERNDVEKELLKNHAELLAPTDAQIGERYGEFAALHKATADRIRELNAKRPAPLEKLSVFTEVSDETPAHHVLIRGLYREPGAEVAPGVPQSLCGRDPTDSQRQYEVPPKSEGQYSSGRRLAFARWLTAPSNPLLARVTVNRIWQNHFGVGIVSTSENFGYTGAEPTHPQLLDELAARWIETGWSMKALHRLIVNSATYRQSSLPDPKAIEVDPQNRLLWRYPLRRLDAEAVRDAMLSISGELDRARFGPYVPTVRQPDGAVVVKEDHAGARRRSIYLQQRRTQILSLLDVFDAPGMVTNCTRRAPSTVALQSLTLMNSDFVLRRAAAFAERLTNEAGPRVEDRIATAFLLALGRAATADERASAEHFLASQQGGTTTDETSEQAWRHFCQMLLAGNASLYCE